MLKTVDFLGEPVTRLIIGDNPINGHTYIPKLISRDDMLRYYTEEKVLEAMEESIRYGCNTWLPLGNDFMLRAVYHHQATVEKPLHFIFQSYAPIEFATNLRMMAEANPLGIYHRGTDTDELCEAGRSDVVCERIRMIKDLGIKAGLGTHVPGTILRAEEEDWGCDFYVACLHNTRRAEDAAPSSFISGKPKEIVFRMEDRKQMFSVIQSIDKPCIAFKVFAGGQIFSQVPQEKWPEMAETALRETYEQLKPIDIACVGVFQRDKNQLRENITLAENILGTDRG